MLRTSTRQEVNTGDIIAFEGGDSVIMHRVQENKVVEGSFVTRGDANDSEDPVKFHTTGSSGSWCAISRSWDRS